MLKNSRLLKYVLDRAALISDGAGVSSNGFVLVLLALLADADMGRLPGEVNSGDVKRELCDVKAVFYGLNFDVFDAISALGNEITSPDSYRCRCRYTEGSLVWRKDGLYRTLPHANNFGAYRCNLSRDTRQCAARHAVAQGIAFRNI